MFQGTGKYDENISLQTKKNRNVHGCPCWNIKKVKC